MNRLKLYYQLTKPRVMLANVLTAAAGFLLAAGYQRHFDYALFIALVAGSSLVIAAACVLNNYLDRDIDSRMERTKTRVSVTGAVSQAGSLVFCAALAVSGFIILSLWTNWLTVAVIAAGFVTYVWLYGALSKRRSVHGTLVGSLSGAAPVLAGYTAVANQIDAGAFLVFAALFFWQMPEFYSIAIYRRKEYAAAGIPVVSVIKGVNNTKNQIFVYTVLFVASSLLLSAFGYTGWVYLIIMGLLDLWWLRLGWQGLKTRASDDWARRMFHFSLIILLAYCLMLALGPILP